MSAPDDHALPPVSDELVGRFLQLEELLRNAPESALYELKLDERCAQHSVAIAGIDIPQFVLLRDYVCSGCKRQFLPRHNEKPACPDCGGSARRVANAPSRRASRRMPLTRKKLGAIVERLNPEREVKRDRRGRQVQGPLLAQTLDGCEEWLLMLVSIRRADGPVVAEDAGTAARRNRGLRELGSLIEQLVAADDAGERRRLAKKADNVRQALGLPVSTGGADATAHDADTEIGDG